MNTCLYIYKAKGNFCFGCRPGTKQNVSGVETPSDVTSKVGTIYPLGMKNLQGSQSSLHK
jgi:hypothetical protein